MKTWLMKSYRAMFAPIGVSIKTVVSWAFEKNKHERDETQLRNGHAFTDIIRLDLVQFEAF